MADNVLFFLNTQILSSGRVKSVPNLEGPIYNSIFLDVLSVISIFTEGHDVLVETEPDKFIKLTPKLSLELMKRYNISNEMIQKLLEKAQYVQDKYDSLNSVKELADQIIAMLGVPVSNLDNIGLLGQAINAIIGSGTLKNFDEVKVALEMVQTKCMDYTDESIEALNGNTITNFLMVEEELEDITHTLLSFSQTMDDILADIRNSTLLKSFKDVEDWAKTAVALQHAQNTDTILDKGGMNEVSAGEIVVALADIAELITRVSELEVSVTYTRRDLKVLEITYNTFHNGVMKDMRTIEEHIKALEDLTHAQGTDDVVGKGSIHEIMVADLKAFMLDTIESLAKLSASSSTVSVDIDDLVQDLTVKFRSILNGENLNSFKSVEDAISQALESVHDQNTDTILDAGGENEIAAKTIKDAINAYKTAIDELKTSVSGILGTSDINSFDDIDEALQAAVAGLHTQNTDTALGEGTDKKITLDDIIYLQEKIKEAIDAGSVIIDDDTVAAAMSKFLANTPDNNTIFVEGSKLVAKKLVGLSSAITELNYLVGTKKNVQSQIDGIVADYTAKINALTGGGGFQGYFATFAALLTASADTAFTDGIYIVGTDETRGSRTTLYRYDKIATVLKYLGTFNIEVRNFTTNPINLDTETVGILPKNKLSTTFLDEIQAIKDALHEQGSDLVMAKGTLAEVTALEIRNAIDKLNLFTRTSAASLINDAVITGEFTWSSFKLAYMFSNVLTTDTAYSKGEADAKFAIKEEIHTHLNKEDILDELDADEYANLTFKGKLVGANLNLIKKTYTELFETDTLSNIIYVRDYLFNHGLIYPTMISIAVENKSIVSTPFQIISMQGTDELVFIDIMLEPGESQIYELTSLNSETYIKSRGKLETSVTVIAYKLADYIESIDTNYHVQGTDDVVGKNTEYAMTVKFIRDNIRKLESLDDSFLHSVNKDTILDKDGPNEISAGFIKSKISNAIQLTHSAILPISTSPATISVECNAFNKAIIEAFVILEDAGNSNISQTISTLIATDKTKFTSDMIDYVAFDGDMKLIDSISLTPTQTNYDGGCLSDVDMSLQVPTSRVTGIHIGTAAVKTLAKVKQENAANLYLRFGAGNMKITKDGWVKVDDAECVNGEYYSCDVSGVPMKFNFAGDSISLIANISSTLATCIVKIDGAEYSFNEYGTDGKNYRVFNIEGLSSMYEHYVEIYLSGTGSINISAIDLNIGSEITIYDETPVRTGGILFYRDAKYYTYENDTYVEKYEALPSSTVFMTEGLANISDVTNVQTYMIRVFTKSIPKKPIVIDFDITVVPIFVTQIANIATLNVMKNIDFLKVTGTNVAVVFSLDDGTTWKSFDGSNNLIDVDTTSVADITDKALSLDDFNLLDWNGYLVDGALNIKLGFLLTDLTSIVNEIMLQYDMSAYLSKINCDYVLKNGTADVTITGYAGKKVVLTKLE